MKSVIAIPISVTDPVLSRNPCLTFMSHKISYLRQLKKS